ncbi:MAG: HlyD family secretion protein [Bacteroidales bacterium]
MNRRNLSTALLLLLLGACKPDVDRADAYGNFESIDLLVSPEVQGRIIRLGVEEGDRLQEDQAVALIDSTQLHLKKEQLQTGLASLRARIHTLDAQVGAQQVQLENLVREQQRIIHLYEKGAATSKQVDDINGQVLLLKAQIAATESQKASVRAERETLDIQILQVEDQLHRCVVMNPANGTVLSKLKEEGEIVLPGQPLYKLANLDELILRAYVSGDRLSLIKVGGPVTVRYDVPGAREQVVGTVSWISPQAEFTPKIIQTREERVSLVYAFKVRVPNGGALKIGMPGEVLFQPSAQ